MTETQKSALVSLACSLSGIASLFALLGCGLFTNAALYTCVAVAVLAIGPAFVAWRIGSLRWWKAVGTIAAPIFCLWLVDAFQQSVLRDSRRQAFHNAAQIAISLQGFHETHQSFPACAITSPDGMPLLSWRLAIYPYVESSPLYSKFHRDEPWDSPANLSLMKPMPWVFQSIPDHAKAASTPWQVFVGPGTAFEPGKKISLSTDFPDGVAYTLLFVEATDLVPWTKPQDLPYLANAPLPKLGQVYALREPLPWSRPHQPTGFFTATADGSVRFVNANVSEEVLRRVIVRNDGKPVADDWYR